MIPVTLFCMTSLVSCPHFLACRKHFRYPLIIIRFFLTICWNSFYRMSETFLFLRMALLLAPLVPCLVSFDGLNKPSLGQSHFDTAPASVNAFHKSIELLKIKSSNSSFKTFTRSQDPRKTAKSLGMCKSQKSQNVHGDKLSSELECFKSLKVTIICLWQVVYTYPGTGIAMKNGYSIVVLRIEKGPFPSTHPEMCTD